MLRHVTRDLSSDRAPVELVGAVRREAAQRPRQHGLAPHGAGARCAAVRVEEEPPRGGVSGELLSIARPHICPECADDESIFGIPHGRLEQVAPRHAATPIGAPCVIEHAHGRGHRGGTVADDIGGGRPAWGRSRRE